MQRNGPNPAPEATATFNLRRFLRHLLVLTGLFVVLGSAYMAVFYARRVAELVVHVGFLPIYVDLPLFVAHQRGLFQEHDVHVQLHRHNASPELAESLTSGTIVAGASIAYANLLRLESAAPGNLKMFMVDAENKDNYLSSVVVLPSSRIDSMESLRGRSIGSFPGPEATTFLKLVLRKYGLTADRDIRISELQSGAHISALKTGAVDALFTYEPIATQAVQELGATKLLPGAVEREIISPWQAGVWVIRSDFLEKHTETARSFIAAIYDAVDYIRENPSIAKSVLNDWTSIPSKVAAATPTIPFTKIGEIDLTALQKHADILHQNGVFPKRVLVNGMLMPPTGIAREGH